MSYKGKPFKIAQPEKAFLDLLYIKTKLREAPDFAGLRVDGKAFLKLMDRGKMNRYLAVFGQKSLQRRTDGFWEYITHA
jgi:hypothetical protein